jgi:membrane-associated phospholipid phosphatase
MRPWTDWARVIVTEVGILLGGIATYVWVAGHAAGRSGLSVGNARALLRFEGVLGINVEHSANAWWTSSSTRVLIGNLYYLLPHFLVPFVLFSLLVIFRPGAYRRFRTSFVLASLIGVAASWAWPTAPPRLVGGFTDTLAAAPVAGFGGPAGMSGAENPFAAFPSMHVGWAVWAALAVGALTHRWWVRGIAWLHAAATAADIVLTGNHWILDGVGGAAVALFAAAVASRRRWLLRPPRRAAPLLPAARPAPTEAAELAAPAMTSRLAVPAGYAAARQGP